MAVAAAAVKKKSRLLISKKSKPQQEEFINPPEIKTPTTSSSSVFLLRRLPSAAILILILIFLWSSSTTIISGNLLHLCISSRKLHNVYCISAGTKPNLDLPLHPDLNERDENNNVLMMIEKPSKNSTTTTFGAGNGELEGAYRNVEELITEQRSWSSSVQMSESTSTCRGGVYVYELPAKFNKDLAAQCGDMMPWENLCKYFNNGSGAMGEPIEKLGKGWYQTHQYSLELIFHSLILNHPCRVYNPNEAKLFYVPFYGGLDILRWHFKNNVSHALKDSLGLELVRWLESQPAWFKKSGKDHVFVLGKISWDFRRQDGYNWGSRFLELDEMQNPIKLLIERQPWHVNDIGIPHPTYFHPQSDHDIISWQQKTISSNRRNLVSFAGAARPDSKKNIRSILIKQCTGNHEKCRFLDCGSGGCDQPESIINLFMESEFCLQPPGDSPTRKSVFDSLVAGCIPVLFNPFTAYYQYPWHLPQDHQKYSVLIDQGDVRDMKVNVVERLAEIGVKERENMRRYIVYELLPGLVYRDPNSAKLHKFKDAFSITMNNLFERVNRLDV
ncbi:xyloglucan-specific galacturonosyltransferase 1-like [Ipomoea triloba]|uniref:xyloglucan-specific galacturonosyltransferase 1-like n=1 Tax=Ipomoea triloba TaxID=35885 RepID=UPI00125DD317|nr:xyloglucan-specific galacturonosyltransferase 1-like [Ipomoea triloba]